MNTLKRINWRSGIAVLAILALFIATVTFGQPTQSNHGQALGLGKLEPALEVLNGARVDPNAIAGVIVQFEDNSAPGDTPEVKNQKKLARRAAILAAGGEADRDNDNFPAHSARLTFKALKELEKHPCVKRISIDHDVQGALATATKAIGADQVWSGAATGTPLHGEGIGIAVIDSRVRASSEWSVSPKMFYFTPDGISADLYGHGHHVMGIIGGNGYYSGPGSGYPEKYLGVANQAKLLSL